MPSSAPDLATGNLARLTGSARSEARGHAFVLEIVLGRRRVLRLFRVDFQALCTSSESDRQSTEALAAKSSTLLGFVLERANESNGGSESRLGVLKGRLALLTSRNSLVRGTSRLPRFRLWQISSREILAAELAEVWRREGNRWLHLWKEEQSL